PSPPTTSVRWLVSSWRSRGTSWWSGRSTTTSPRACGSETDCRRGGTRAVSECRALCPWPGCPASRAPTSARGAVPQDRRRQRLDRPPLRERVGEQRDVDVAERGQIRPGGEHLQVGG